MLVKFTLMLGLVAALLSCKMATEQQQEPLQQGLYFSRDAVNGVTKKIVVTDKAINYYNSSELTSPSKIFSYRKVNKVMMDFSFIYTHLKDGTALSDPALYYNRVT